MDDDSPFAGPPTDDDLTIPRAAMNKLIKELCPNMRVATESRYNQPQNGYQGSYLVSMCWFANFTPDQ